MRVQSVLYVLSFFSLPEFSIREREKWLVLAFKIQKIKIKKSIPLSMWKDPIPFYYPPLCFKIGACWRMQLQGSGFLPPHPLFYFGETQRASKALALIMYFCSWSFKRSHLKARWIGRMRTLGAHLQSLALQSLRKESGVFLQNEVPVLTIVNHFIYVVVLTHPFRGMQEATFCEGEEKKEMCELPLVLSCIQADRKELQKTCLCKRRTGK